MNRKVKAVIFDLDGVLADNSHRVKLAKQGKWKECFERSSKDKVNLWALQILNAFEAEGNCKIFIVTGRSEGEITVEQNIYRKITEQWLSRHGIYYNGLYMRLKGDCRSDVIVKSEIVKVLASHSRILFAVEDNPEVADAYRKLGLIVLQCQTKMPAITFPAK